MYFFSHQFFGSGFFNRSCLPIHARLFFFALVLIITSCASIDEVPKTNSPAPKNWQFAQGDENNVQINSDWWKSFGSPQLNQLIEIAQQKNTDVKIAAEHAKQAELQMRIANASLFPSISFSASTGERNTKVPASNMVGVDSTSATFNASYELDLWGGEYANRLSAKQSYRSAQFTRVATQLSIEAAVATAWFNYLALEERISTAKKNIELATRIQGIVNAQYRNGAASSADLAAQTTNLLNLQNSLLPLQLQIDQTHAAIALLQAELPQNFVLTSEPIDQILIPEIHPGLPNSLMARRPDVAASEAQLAAASANIYAARTAFLPSANLAGNIGKSGSQLFSLNPAMQTSGWSLGLLQTIFAGGRIKNQFKLTESRQVELVEQYRKVVLTAYQETDDALNRIAIYQQQEINQQEIFKQAEINLKLSEAGYKEGGKDLLSLLDAQRTLFQARDALVQVRLSRLKSAVDLYKALGGGWSAKDK